MLISPRILYQHCYSRYGLAAVNVFTMEQVLGLFAAADKFAAPIIVQITPAARQYAHPVMLKAMVDAAARMYPQVVYALHLDHGLESHILPALEEGYTSVMIDASHDDYATNVRRTRAVDELAHTKNIVVEAELGVLSGVEDDLEVDEQFKKYTDPRQAKDFVEQTGCTSLAVAVGTSHGAYKFSGGQGLQFNILEQIQSRLPGYPLVLHGSSLVDGQIIQRINQHGGKLKPEAAGVTDSEIKRAITLGVCKINIATDLRLLWTCVHREFFAQTPELFDPVIPGKKYMEAYIAFMGQRFEVLGSTGKADELIK